MPIPNPGRTRPDPDDLPPEAAGATIRDVAWLDRHGRVTDDRDKIARIIVDYREDDETPLLTVYGTPPDDDG